MHLRYTKSVSYHSLPERVDDFVYKRKVNSNVVCVIGTPSDQVELKVNIFLTLPSLPPLFSLFIIVG